MYKTQMKPGNSVHIKRCSRLWGVHNKGFDSTSFGRDVPN